MAIKSKRYELVILFMLASWGIGRGFFEALGFLLFPGVNSADNWTLYVVREYIVYGLSGLSLGLCTWLALRWLDFRPSRRIAILLSGGFFASWSGGISLILFLFSPNFNGSWNVGYLIIGALCGTVVGLVIRQLASISIKRLLTLIFLFALIFLAITEFGSRLISDLSNSISFESSIVFYATAQGVMGGLLSSLAISFVTGKAGWISLRWRDFIFAILVFIAADTIAYYVFQFLASNSIGPWFYNAITAAGWGTGIALATRRRISIPFYIILFVLGVTFARIFWVGSSFRFFYQSGTFYNLARGLIIGLFIVVGVKRLATVLLMLATAILAFSLGNIVPIRYTDLSGLNWLIDFSIAIVNGLVLMWGMYFWGVLHPAGAPIKSLPLKEDKVTTD